MIDYNNKSDSDLVSLTLKDPDLFAYIVNRYKDKLASYIRRLSNISEDEIEDVLQEVFLKTYLNLNDFDEELKFSSWIYRITHNQVISRYRKLKARPEGYAYPIDDVLINKLKSDEDLIADIDLDINKKSIAKVLYKLDKKYREILVLKFLEEKSYQEISYILKKPLGTVASTVNKAKEKFRLEISKQNLNF